MKRSTRSMLDKIDAFLVRNALNDSAHELWDVLSALRGPDDTRERTRKSASTEIVRSVAFPKLARREKRPWTKISTVPATFADPGDTDIRLGPPGDMFSSTDASSHFRTHILRAAKALGLDWKTDV